MVSIEQKIAAMNIRHAYLKLNIRYAILMAKCQSGKTGAFQNLVRQMMFYGDVKQVFILCGSNETELRNQAIADTKAANGESYASGAIKVLFRQDFKGVTMDIEKALIVVDESHLDQTQMQELDVFLGRHGLSMDGNPEKLVEANAYILSVDATPYSEISALAHQETPFPKHVESLRPGKNYFGLADYLYTGRIAATFDITTNASRFEGFFGNTPKWGLVRLTTGKHASEQEEAIQSICRSNRWPVLFFTAEKEQVAITRGEDTSLPCLEDAPVRNTVVIIRGRLRAGKVVPKTHIAFVWEGSKESKTDALVQGLPGRMCGYAFGEEKPLIFVPASSLARHEDKEVKASEIERAIMDYPLVLPLKGTNLMKSFVASRAPNGKTLCPPLRLEWDASMCPEAYVQAQHSTGAGLAALKQDCYDLLWENRKLIDDSPYYSAEQKAEILESIIPSGWTASHVNNLHGKKDLPRFASVLGATQSGTAPHYHLEGHHPLNFLVVRPGYQAPGANSKYLYVIFYTDASADVGLQATNILSRIPKTNERSVFSPHERHLDAPPVAMGGACFTDGSIKTPATFEAALREYLTLWRTSEHLTMTRTIQSASDRFKLDKAVFNYKSPKDNALHGICARLGTEFGAKLTLKFSRCGEDHFNLKEISW